MIGNGPQCSTERPVDDGRGRAHVWSGNVSDGCEMEKSRSGSKATIQQERSLLLLAKPANTRPAGFPKPRIEPFERLM